MNEPFIDRSNQLPVLLSVDSSVYRTLAWRSSGENALLFRALPLYSCYDTPSPLMDARSPCQFNCGPFFQPSLTPAGVLSFHPYPVTVFLNSLLESFCHDVPFLWTKSFHSHPLCDASHNESSASNFDWEMHSFPPRLLTLSDQAWELRMEKSAEKIRRKNCI